MSSDITLFLLYQFWRIWVIHDCCIINTLLLMKFKDKRPSSLEYMSMLIDIVREFKELFFKVRK